MDPLNFTKELCENIINNFNQYELSLKMRIEREKNKALVRAPVDLAQQFADLFKKINR